MGGDRRGFDRILSQVAAGAVIGGMTGGPMGALGGAATPPATLALGAVAREFRERVLGQREAERVVTALRLAQERIVRKMEAGERPRNDEFFFMRHGSGPPAAEYLLEAALLAAQRDYAERKVPYYANAYVHIAFSEAVDVATADLLVLMAESLSYLEMGLLALVGHHDRFSLPPSVKLKAEGLEWRHLSVRKALDGIGFAQKDLVYAAPPTVNAAASTGGTDALPALPTNIGIPSDLRLHGWGQALFDVLDLREFPEDELRILLDDLWDGSADERPNDA